MILARLVEKLVPQHPDIGRPPVGIAVEEGKCCALEPGGQSGPALGQVAVFRLEAVVVELPVGVTGGEVREFIGGDALPALAADRQEPVQHQEGRHRGEQDGPRAVQDCGRSIQRGGRGSHAGRDKNVDSASPPADAAPSLNPTT